jgi:branched-chain amino acid transport system permease protein
MSFPAQIISRVPRNAARAALESAWPVLALMLPLAAVALLVSYFADIYVQSVVVEALIKVVIVVGLYLFVGNSGIISFGHVTFMGIAAYIAAWATCCPGLKPITMPGLPEFLRTGDFPVLPTAAAAIVVAGLAAAGVGLILMRLSGLAASISTLAVLFIFHVLYSNWDSVTMGTSSIVGLPTVVTPGLAMTCATLAIVATYLFQVSRWGLALRASREDDVAAQAAGISLYGARLVAFTLSGFIEGMAGVLYAHFLGTVSVDTFFLNLTFITLAMLVVGGMFSLAGAVVGVVSLSIVIELFRQIESGVSVAGVAFSLPAGTQELVLAAFMLLVLIFRRDGLMGGREITWPFRRRDGAGGKDTA